MKIIFTIFSLIILNARRMLRQLITKALSLFPIGPSYLLPLPTTAPKIPAVSEIIENTIKRIKTR